MSLQVWLPLNGSLENQGLSDLVFINNGAIINNNGKIGKCYSFNNTTITSTPTTNFKSKFNNEGSLALWVKISTSHSAYAQVITFGTVGTSWNNILFGIDINGSGVPIANTSTGSAYTNCSAGIAIKDNVWHHLIATFNTNQIKIYIDGVLKNTVSTSNIPNWSSASVISIGGNSSEVFKNNDLINDVRIYNHCLSQKEVEEISKGLILHYKLDLPTGLTDLGKKTLSVYNNYSGSGTTGSLTALAETYEGYTVYRENMVPNDTSLSNFRNTLHSHGVYNGTYTFKANTKYVYWIYYRPITNTSDIRVGGTASNIGNWTEIPPVAMGNGWYRVGQYRNGSVTTDKTDNVFTSFYTPTASSGVGITIDWGPSFMIEGTTEIPNTNNFSNNIIYDVSGYNNNGNTTGIISTNTDTAKYNNSIFITDGLTNYITSNNLYLSGDNITMNFWFKSSNKSPGSGYHMPLESYNYGHYEMSIYQTGYLRAGLYINGTRYVDNCTSTKLTDGTWHMCTMTYDGTTIKRYVDAVMEKSTSISGTLTAGLNSFVIGHYGSNTTYYSKDMYLSDVRIYVTALTDSQIKELYDTSATIDNLGNIYARELIEN